MTVFCSINASQIRLGTNLILGTILLCKVVHQSTYLFRCLSKNRNDDINFDFSAFFLFNIGYWCHYLIPAAIWRNKLNKHQVSHGNATILKTILQMTIHKNKNFKEKRYQVKADSSHSRKSMWFWSKELLNSSAWLVSGHQIPPTTASSMFLLPTF